MADLSIGTLDYLEKEIESLNDGVAKSRYWANQYAGADEAMAKRCANDAEFKTDMLEALKTVQAKWLGK